MKRSVQGRLERVFASAVALQQSGRLRSTIYCYHNYVYILNQDRTCFLQFRLRSEEVSFQHPISFEANDYDSNVFEERDGKIVFIVQKGDWIREKRCRSPQFSPEKVHETFAQMKKVGKSLAEVVLNDQFVQTLDEQLSHVEFLGKDGKLIVLQRNIYSGALIHIQKEKSKGLSLKTDNRIGDFGPVGIRTNDLLALFALVSSVKFTFTDKGMVKLTSKDPRMPYLGLLSQCVYDQLGRED